MFKIKLHWQLFYSYLLIIGISLLAASWYASNYIRHSLLDFVKKDLEDTAKILAKTIHQENLSLEQADLDALCRDLSAIFGTRLTIILPDGKIIGESKDSSSGTENHANSLEIQEALQGKVGESNRYSNTVKQEMKYVAIPFRQGDEIVGVIRASYPASAINVRLESIYFQIGLGGVVIALLAIIISLYFSHEISYPMKKLHQGAARFAKGELNDMIPEQGSKEFESLAGAMNNMAAQLNDRILKEIENRSQHEAILTSMVEGVVAVNKNKEVISINQAAARWLGLNGTEVEGKNLLQHLDNPAFNEFINEALSSTKPIEQEIELDTFNVRYVQAQSSALRDSEGKLTGSVIVMHDVTRIRRLESVRQEFVGNVSHELKTPITSIKGFVETLLDGAVNDPKDAERFLNIINKQADRLHAIIEDLLSLSRIEQDEQQGSIPLSKADVSKTIKNAMENCMTKLEDKNIRFISNFKDGIMAEINEPLLEQALVNLIDNAVKYSDPDSSIKIVVSENEFETVISVQDNGCGISKEHLPRLFERFYRVDKARSRKMGGTGLGLAIVKHITQAHNGYVDVESELGEGTTFHIHLPKPD